MPWLLARLEVPNAKGAPVLYPSFVREIEGGSAGGPLARLIDCWAPTKLSDPVLDYEQGCLHFADAHRVALENENFAFIVNVLHAMADHGLFEAIEQGFVVALCRRAIIGARPGQCVCRRLDEISPDEQRAYEDDAWDFVDACRSISAVNLLIDQTESAIAGKTTSAWNRVYLSVLAGLAYNGALH